VCVPSSPPSCPPGEMKKPLILAMRGFSTGSTPRVYASTLNYYIARFALDEKSVWPGCP